MLMGNQSMELAKQDVLTLMATGLGAQSVREPRIKKGSCIAGIGIGYVARIT